MSDANIPVVPVPQAPVAVAPVAAVVEAAPVVAAVEPVVSAEPAVVVPEPAPVEIAEPAAPVVAQPVVEATPEPEAPVEAKPDGDAPDAVAEPVIEAPKYDFKLQDDFKVDPDKLSGFTDILGKHNVSPEAAQEILDLYQNETKAFREAQAQHQQDVWAKTNADWVKSGEKRFGNRYNTMLNDARSVITDIFPDKKERAEFWNVLGMTGAGNHPATMLFCARVAKKLGERSAPSTGLPNTGRGGAPWERRYGASQKSQ